MRRVCGCGVGGCGVRRVCVRCGCVFVVRRCGVRCGCRDVWVGLVRRVWVCVGPTYTYTSIIYMADALSVNLT